MNIAGTFTAFSQHPLDTYQNLWKVISSDTTSKEVKLNYLNNYLQKARTERNILEEYRALEKKTYLLPFNDAVMLLHKMTPLIQKLDSDSLTGDYLNRSTILYYKNRFFKEALDYAIQSKTFNEKINNLYNLNASLVDIGNVYYHTRRYQTAASYFSKARDYYRTKNDYNHLRSYTVTLYSLGKTYWQLGDIVSLDSIINESERNLHNLKASHKTIEIGYLSYIKGGQLFLQKNYASAENYFQEALPVIIKNEDFTNEHVIYLYLGKIAWNQNKRQKALDYFKKIDSLFHEKKFLNYELREAYDYLNQNYKETGQTELQLQVTENLIALNQQFEKEQQHLSDVLYYQHQTQKLESDRKTLRQQIENAKNPSPFYLILAGIPLLFFAIYRYRKMLSKNKKKQVQTNNIQQVPVQKEGHTKHHKPIPHIEQVSSNELNLQIAMETISEEGKGVSLSQTEQRLMDQLEFFEREKQFLNPVTLDNLAKQLGTNRNTLSQIINTHKGCNFATYLIRLKVAEISNDLIKNAELRKINFQLLADQYGFTNAKTFSMQFKNEMKISPSEFIKNLDSKENG